MSGTCGGKERLPDPLDGVTDGCEPLCGCWETKPGPLEEQPVHLPTESSLQFEQHKIFKESRLMGLSLTG